ncbi:MAG: Spy/CpxP family protein refolding chaperone [Pseudomonadota bacterium]
MKRTTKIITAVALTIGIAGGAAAYGKHQFGSMEKRADKIAGYIAYELELDETQKQALDVLKTQMVSARETVKGDRAEMKAEAMALLNAESFDRAAALDMVNSKVAMVNEQAPDMVNALGDFLDTLNAEQKAEIAEFVEEHRGRHGRKHR